VKNTTSRHATKPSGREARGASGRKRTGFIRTARIICRGQPLCARSRIGLSIFESPRSSAAITSLGDGYHGSLVAALTFRAISAPAITPEQQISSTSWSGDGATASRDRNHRKPWHPS